MKSKNALSGLVFLSLIFWATGFCVSAEPALLTLKWYRSQKTNNPAAMWALELYLKGLGDGLEWANTELKATRRQQPLFCVPPELGLRAGNFVDILETELQSARRPLYEDDTLLPLILLQGLKNTFPCPK